MSSSDTGSGDVQTIGLSSGFLVSILVTQHMCAIVIVRLCYIMEAVTLIKTTVKHMRNALYTKTYMYMYLWNFCFAVRGEARKQWL